VQRRGKRGRGEGRRSPRRERGEDSEVGVEGDRGRGRRRAPPPPQTTAVAAPPQTKAAASPQTTATAWGRAEASAAGQSGGNRVRRLGFGRGRDRSGREERGRSVFTLSLGYAWRTPQRCATDNLCVAHHIGVRHACLRIVQNEPKCSLDNNLHLA
jgi:hypothetical protein